MVVKYQKVKDFPCPLRRYPLRGLMKILKDNARYIIDKLGDELTYEDIDTILTVAKENSFDFWENGKTEPPDKYVIVIYVPVGERTMQMDVTEEPLERILSVLDDAIIYGYYEVVQVKRRENMRNTLEERVLKEKLGELRHEKKRRLRAAFTAEYHKLKEFPQPVRDCPATGLLYILKADARMLVDNLGKTLGYNDIEQLEIVVNVVNPDFWEGGEEATFPDKYNIVLHTPPNDRRMRMELTVEPIERVLEVMCDAEIYGYYQVDYDDTPEKRECNDFTCMTFKTEEVLDLVKDIIKAKRLMASICDRMIIVANTIGREEFIKELSKKDEEPRYDPTIFDDNGEDYEEDPHYLNRDHGLEI